ncbi:hypothetical protein LSH36_765g01031 [Paralvinella palmiformis]|uniref:Uncharacterized protein n=1 Tax=Paralvinella palmiformis TaxID=53620 RepID=A0AAD9J1I0_9ANNE|nr:hypothetical protein LSH36_765g01031 [Paralvinella palmiformis]
MNCDVKSVVTDNSRSMEKMRKESLEQDSDLIVYGCSAHWLQLLGRDNTPISHHQAHHYGTEALQEPPQTPRLTQ